METLNSVRHEGQDYELVLDDGIRRGQHLLYWRNLNTPLVDIPPHVQAELNQRVIGTSLAALADRLLARQWNASPSAFLNELSNFVDLIKSLKRDESLPDGMNQDLQNSSSKATSDLRQGSPVKRDQTENHLRRWCCGSMTFPENWMIFHTAGHGPQINDDFRNLASYYGAVFLDELACEADNRTNAEPDVHSLVEHATRNLDNHPVFIWVFGRYDWDDTSFDSFLSWRRRYPLFAATQEQILATVLTGDESIVTGGDLRVGPLTEDHPAIERLLELFPNWSIGTEIPQDQDPIAVINKRQKIGILKHHGYEVGERSKPRTERHAILKRVFTQPLEWIRSDAYMYQWGEPFSAKRLERIANEIATFCHDGKKRSPQLKSAINHWTEDLDWLRAEFYDRTSMRFPWPQTERGQWSI